nr:retrovirus-related Pol polyprotein from transposon 17.6 [Tanacetum cinerariifolium]GEX07176.1 retrovirus-related Pol polyprotein from transposon 17.6 [Tanacetum cinerariifolium]
MVMATRNNNAGNNPGEEESMRDLVLRLHGSIDQLNSKVSTIETSYVYLNLEFTRLRNGEGSSRQYSQMTKLEFLKFTGEDVKGRLYRCHQFFKVDNVDESEKVKLASIHLYDKALAWHKQFEKIFMPKTLYDAYQLARIQETVRSVNTKRPPTTQLALPSTPFKKSVSPAHTYYKEGFQQKEYEEKRLRTYVSTVTKRHVERQDVRILVDSGSTHNFVDVLCTKILGCEIICICPLQVEVPGGNQMLSTSTCRQFAWSLQGQIFKSNVMLLPLEKYVFAVNQLEYLGHVISAKSVVTDPSMIEAMKSWPVPRNIKELRGFLGLTGYYKRFIKGFVTISHPLTRLLKKNAFKWSDSAQEAFDQLKQAMIQMPVLALPNFDAEFVIETGASRIGLGAALQQGGHPIAYLSNTLAPKHQSLSTYEKKFMAVVLALEK